MSKREVLMRYNAIIKKLKKSPATLKEIEADLAMHSELLDYNLKISKRTFQRDVKTSDLCMKSILNMISRRKPIPLSNRKMKT